MYIHFGYKNGLPLILQIFCPFPHQNVRLKPLFSDEFPEIVCILKFEYYLLVVQGLNILDARNWEVKPAFIKRVRLSIAITPKLNDKSNFALHSELLLEWCRFDIPAWELAAYNQILMNKSVSIIWLFCLRCADI